MHYTNSHLCFFAVVRNAVVRATIKVNGKFLFWASVAPKPWINRPKIWLGWLRWQCDPTCQKWHKLAQQGRRGKGVKYNVQLGYFFTWLVKLWRTHFWEHRRIFCTGCLLGIDFLGGSHHLSLIFSPSNAPKAANFRLIFGLRKITTENPTIMHGKSVYLSAPSSTFPVAQLWTPTTAFESLGLRYVPLPCSPICPMGSLRGRGLFAGSSFPADSVKFVSIVLSP